MPNLRPWDFVIPYPLLSFSCHRLAQTWVFSLLELLDPLATLFAFTGSPFSPLLSASFLLSWSRLWRKGWLSDTCLNYWPLPAAQLKLVCPPQDCSFSPTACAGWPKYPRTQAGLRLIPCFIALLAQPEVHTQIGTFWACVCSLAQHHSKGQVGAHNC